MKTSVERIDDTTVKLHVTVEAARVDAAIDHAARALAETVNVPGFRRGRVPRKVLESRLGKDTVVAEAAREALPQFYGEAVQAEGLAVVGRPELDVETFESGTDASFAATVEVRPEIEVPDYEGLQIPHPDWEVTDEEVDAQLDALRERFAELESVQRAAKPGDYAVVTITGERHGQKVDDASGEDVLYQVRDPDQTGSELDRNLVGATPGAILKFNDTLGADYGERAGEEVTFTTIVKDVKEKRLPDLDDDFAITASEFDTIDELRAAVRTQIGEQKRAYAVAALRGVVVEQVAELVDVPLPSSLIQEELQHRFAQIAREAEGQGQSIDVFLQAADVSPEELTAQLEDEAQRTVKAQLVVDAIGRAAEVSVDQEDLGIEIARQSARLGRPPEELARFMLHPDRIGALVSDAFRRKTIDHLLSRVQVLGGPPPQAEEPVEQEQPEPEDAQA